MKKFGKGILIAAGVLAMVGIGFTAAGAAMGGISEEPLQELERRFAGALGGGNGNHGWERVHVQSGEEILPAETESMGDMIYRFPVKDNLELDLRYEELILEEQDKEEITVEIIGDGDDVKIKEDGNTLEISSSRKIKNQRIVKVSYPKGTEFREVELKVGAGRMELKQDFTARELDISLGAGEAVNSGTITATEIDLEVGTGSMQLDHVDAKKIDGECGMGEMKLTLAGSQNDYSYSLECGMGAIKLGSEEYGGLGREKKITNPGAERYLDLECGIGEISVEFMGN